MTRVGNIIHPSSEYNNVQNQEKMKSDVHTNSQEYSKGRNTNENNEGRESIESPPDQAVLCESQTDSEHQQIDVYFQKRTRYYSVGHVCDNESSDDKVQTIIRSRRNSRRRSHSLPTGSELSQKFFQGTLTPACEKKASDQLFDTDDTPKYRGWNNPNPDEDIARRRVVCLDIPSEILIRKMPQIAEN